VKLNIYIIFSVWREICTLRNEKLHTRRPDTVTHTEFQCYSFRYDAQMAAARDFNRAVKAIHVTRTAPSSGSSGHEQGQGQEVGVYQTGADAYSFSGANKWNHADTDAFGHLPFWEQLTVGRMYVELRVSIPYIELR
jgi:hypothetical protein